MDIKIVILDRERLDEPVTVDFVNPLTNAWILRLDIWANSAPELTVQWAQLKPDTIEIFLSILCVGANLLNTLHGTGAKSFSDVSDVVNAASDDAEDVTFSLN